MTTIEGSPISDARQALAAHDRAIATLIELLRAPDESDRREAAQVLYEMDPPPVWQLFRGFRECDDKDFRLRVVATLERIATVAPVPVSSGLLRLLRGDLDPEVREAVHRATGPIGELFRIAMPSELARKRYPTAR